MSVADAPDWFNAGGANPFSAQAALISGVNVAHGAPDTITLPLNVSPYHTLGLWCAAQGLARMSKLTVTGVTSGIVYYNGYLEADTVRFGGPVVIPITALFDTQFIFSVDIGTINSVWAWLYLESVPPVSRPYASQTLNKFNAIVGNGIVQQLLPADATCTSFILDSITYAIGDVGAACDLYFIDPSVNVYSLYSTTGKTTFHDDLGQVVVPANVTYSTKAFGPVLTSSQVTIRYRRSFTLDGLDVL